MFKIIFILCLIFEFATAATCPGSIITDAIQATIVGKHNNFRSELAKGLATIKGGAKASGAKNMYQFTYDCALEATAQTQANKCLGATAHSTQAERNNAGENLYSNSPASTNSISGLTDAMNSWWNELLNLGGITPTNVVLTQTNFDLGIGHWTQMAWGKTTTVGCAYKTCPKQNTIVCHYKIAGNTAGENIYEIGTGCTSDAECTTYENSKCNTATKLCCVGDSCTSTSTSTTTTTTTTTTTKAGTTGWTEWAASSCTANCGLCGRVITKRVCRSGSCPGTDTKLTTTACGAASLCPFGLGLASCCEPAKRAIINGVLSCA